MPSVQKITAENCGLKLGRVLEMSSTKFAITNISSSPEQKPIPYLDGSYFKLVAEATPLNMRVYKTISPLPMAYFINNWRWIENQTQDVEAITHADISKFDAHKVVLLSGSSEQAKPLITTNRTFDQSVVVAAKLKYLSPEHLEIDCNCPSDGVIVLNDQFYPGWEATLDGKKAIIIRANMMFKALAVPAGAHHIVYEYRPRSLSLALLASIAALVFLFVAICFSHSKRLSAILEDENRLRDTAGD
jgi:hypothetical protein